MRSEKDPSNLEPDQKQPGASGGTEQESVRNYVTRLVASMRTLHV